MKKIFRLIAALAAATVAFSCMEEANPETPETDNNAGTHYEGPMTTLEFSVDELTKTSYDKENGHQWSEGDQIKIIWGTEDDAYVIAEVVDGFVTATVGDVETFYAVYPETTVYELTEGQIYVVFPKTQDGSFKQANIMAAKTTKNDKNFAKKFMDDPVEALEGVLDVDLPDDQIEMIIDGIKAKIKLDSLEDLLDGKADLGDIAGKLGGFLKKK